MQTDFSFLDRGQSWPPPLERARLAELNDYRQLWKSRHEKVWDAEFWQRVFREELRTYYGIVFNWPKRISTLWADLLLGETPTVVTDEKEQEYLDDLVSRLDFWNVAYEAAIDGSRYGDSLFKIRLAKNKALVRAFSPRFWYPVVSPQDTKEIVAHVLAWTSEDKSRLFVEIHERGKVSIRTYALDKDGTIGLILEEADESVQVDGFLVCHAANIGDSEDLYGVSDYNDLTSIVQELELRFAQIARILDKHSDPSMYGPYSAIAKDESGRQYVDTRDKYFPLEEGDSPPGYITWDGQLDASFREIEQLMGQFYAISETSAAAFGELKSGLAESGSALKRLLMAPLAKVNRFRAHFDKACREALETAALLEGKKLKVKIEWKDGIPDDEAEESRVMSERITAGTISRRRAIQRLDGLKGEDLKQELEAIKEDQEAEGVTPPEIGFDGTGGGEE